MPIQVVALVKEVFPTALVGFPLCCVVWTWDSLFYGASDFVYNAKTIAFASAVGASGILASLKFGWGLSGLWISMVSHLFLGKKTEICCCFFAALTLKSKLHTSIAHAEAHYGSDVIVSVLST
jgi:hypothetical protein